MNSRTQWMTCLTKLLLFGSYSDQTRKMILRWYIWTTIPMEEENLYSLTLIVTQKGKNKKEKKKRKTKNLSESPPLVWFVEDPRSLASCGFCFAEEYVLLVVWFEPLRSVMGFEPHEMQILTVVLLEGLCKLRNWCCLSSQV